MDAHRETVIHKDLPTWPNLTSPDFNKKPIKVHLCSK
jgi:hypothetical protein